MAFPQINNLRLENWQNISTGMRLQALQNLESSIAFSEGREACHVQFIPDDKYEITEDHQALRGYHEDKSIFINDQLVKNNTPYLATETLFHEARHDYQEHLVLHPEKANDMEQLGDFQKNLQGGYLSNEMDGYPLYRWQPVEKDANEIARQKTEDLYAGEFGDNVLYPEHRQQMETERAQDMEVGQLYIGNDYSQKAREKMIATYQDVQQEAQNALHSVQAGQESNISEDEIYESAGEITGEAIAGPVGGSAGKLAGEAAQEVQAEALNSAGQSTKDPSEGMENDTSESDEENRYDYGYGY